MLLHLLKKELNIFAHSLLIIKIKSIGSRIPSLCAIQATEDKTRRRKQNVVAQALWARLA
jgi:hypothetical protein